jgi:hypothetical protein
MPGIQGLYKEYAMRMTVKIAMGILALSAAVSQAEEGGQTIAPGRSGPAIRRPEAGSSQDDKIIDSIELQQGDKLKGTILDEMYSIQTFFGKVELKANQVVGIVNVKEAKPRQLVTMANGDVYGGRLENDSVTIRLSSGQTMKTPLSLISSVAYRKEGRNPITSSSLVVLQSGERYRIETPPSSLSIATQYGVMSVSPDKISQIVFQLPNKTSHMIGLKDGSSLSGFLCEEVLELNLPGRKVKFSAVGMTRLQFSEPIANIAGRPTMTMENKDTLIGVIDQTVKLQTEIAMKEIPGGDIVKMTKLPEIPGGVRIVLKEDVTMTGQILDSELNVKLNCGLSVKASALMIVGYSNAVGGGMSPATEPAKAPTIVPVENPKRAAAEKADQDMKAAEVDRIMKERQIQMAAQGKE